MPLFHTQNRNSLLIWDVHASHKHQDVLDYAAARNIKLLFIPAGTDTHSYTHRHVQTYTHTEYSHKRTLTK
jgi:hypothetical protein